MCLQAQILGLYMAAPSIRTLQIIFKASDSIYVER